MRRPGTRPLALAATRMGACEPGEMGVAASAQSPCEDLFVLHKFAAEVLRAPAVAGPWARFRGGPA